MLRIGLQGTVFFGLLVAHLPAEELLVSTSELRTTLSLGDEPPFHVTTAHVTNPRVIHVPGSSVVLALWTERTGSHGDQAFYALSKDGKRVDQVRMTSYHLQLKYATFDPLAAAPDVQESLRADGASRLHLVQFVVPSRR